MNVQGFHEGSIDKLFWSSILDFRKPSLKHFEFDNQSALLSFDSQIMSVLMMAKLMSGNVGLSQ